MQLNDQCELFSAYLPAVLQPAYPQFLPVFFHLDIRKHLLMVNHQALVVEHAGMSGIYATQQWNVGKCHLHFAEVSA